MTLWSEWFILLLKAFLRSIRLGVGWFSADHTIGRREGAGLSKPAEVGGCAETGHQDDDIRSLQVDTGFQHRRLRAGGCETRVS